MAAQACRWAGILWQQVAQTGPRGAWKRISTEGETRQGKNEASKLVDKQANKGSMSTYVSWQYSNCVSPELCIYLKAFDYYFEIFTSDNERKLAFRLHCCPKQALSKMHLWTRPGELWKIPSHQWLPIFFPNPHHQPLNPLDILLFFLFHFNSSWTLKATIFCNCSRKTNSLHQKISTHYF